MICRNCQNAITGQTKGDREMAEMKYRICADARTPEEKASKQKVAFCVSGASDAKERTLEIGELHWKDRRLPWQDCTSQEWLVHHPDRSSRQATHCLLIFEARSRTRVSSHSMRECWQRKILHLALGKLL